MIIRKLPQHLINQLKAGEIVERPASIVKELLENALDAWATELSVEIQAWWKKLIKVKDNWSWMSKDDLLLSIERYATSKIDESSNLEAIESYWFRWEALASVSEVSIFRIQSKTEDTQDGIWFELYRSEWRYSIKEIPFPNQSGTIVYVEDVFHHIPAREKFLKSDATERNYIKTLFLQYALVQRDKKRSLVKDWKQLFMFPPCWSLLERILQVTKKDREKNFKQVEYKDQQLELYGLVGDASLHFATGQYFWIFVNGRPVQDRLLKRAVMESYKRQIVPWSYPFVCLFVEIDPEQVDVNVHPRKLEVKFLDPWSIYTRVNETISQLIWHQKVNYASFAKPDIQEQRSTGDWNWYRTNHWAGMTKQELHSLKEVGTMRNGWMFGVQDVDRISYVSRHDNEPQELVQFVWENELYKLVGQLRDSYILLESSQALIYIDQHALAERIAFEKMKSTIAQDWFQSEVLLQPLSLEIPHDVELEKKLTQLQSIWFDVSLLSDSKVVIYALPQVFHQWKVNIELILNRVRSSSDDALQGMDFFGLMLDEIIGMKACKASIKAGQTLSQQEMKQLVQDWFEYISGMFVCQHGRPSAVRIEKGNIDNLFERH